MKKIYCYLHKQSIILEGNMNAISIYQQLLLNYNDVFTLSLNMNYSYNQNVSNMKVETLPCIYYENNLIKREEIYSFFKRAITYAYVDNSNSNEYESNDVNHIEQKLLENLIVYDFQEILDYINYTKKRRNVMRFIQFVYQPYKTINSAVTDKEIANVYEKKHLISNKYNAIDMVRYVNRKVDLFLKNKNIEDINVHFKLLVLSFIQTQKMFFGEDKIIKYKLNQYENINSFYNSISNNKEMLIGNIKDIQFVPERGISNNINKSINSSNNSNGSNNNEENVSVRSNKFILQVIGFSALFSVLYYIKNKII